MPRLSARAGQPASGICCIRTGCRRRRRRERPTRRRSRRHRRPARSGRAGGRPRLVGRDLATGLTAAAGRARHLSGGVAERGADLVDLELDGGALLALARLVGALLEATGRDDAGALRQRARDVLGELAPHARAEEQRFAVLPLVRLAVEVARRRRDREVRDGESVLRVAQFGISREVAHDGDDRLAGHGRYASCLAGFAGRAALRAAFSAERSASAATIAMASSARRTLVRMICSLRFS